MMRTPMPMPPRTATATLCRDIPAAGGEGGLPIKQFNELRQQGFPQGLALEVGDSRTTFPVRFWSIDNSSGMDSDQSCCKQVKYHPDSGRTTVERCSRWNELRGTMEDQIGLSGLMGVSSIFCLRNGESGKRKFSVADPTSQSVANDVKRATQGVLEAPALGCLPLSKHVREFSSRIKLLESTLLQNNQKALCVLTVGSLPADENGNDSEQSKEQFLMDLAELGGLPVSICVRLCGDDKDTAEFYNNLTHTGLPLVVIGMFCVMSSGAGSAVI